MEGKRGKQPKVEPQPAEPSPAGYIFDEDAEKKDATVDQAIALGKSPLDELYAKETRELEQPAPTAMDHIRDSMQDGQYIPQPIVDEYVRRGGTIPEGTEYKAAEPLVPAVKTPEGEVIEGEKGDTHPEVMKAEDIPPDAEHDRGFTRGNEDFMTRDQAKADLKKKEPEVYGAWENIINERGGDPAQAELHSEDLNEARRRVEYAKQGTEQIEGAEEPSKKPKSWFELGKVVAQEYINQDREGTTTILKPNINIVRKTAEKLGLKLGDAQRAIAIYNSEDPVEASKAFSDREVPTIGGKEGPVDDALLEKKARLEDKISRLDDATTQSDKTDMPGAYVTGPSGVPRSRMKKIDQQLDRRIDRANEAVQLQKDLEQVNAQIEAQKKKPQRNATEKLVKDYSQKQFDTIEVGDSIDVGGNASLKVIKKNQKSVLTEGGTKWDADEIAKVIKAEKRTPESTVQSAPSTEASGAVMEEPFVQKEEPAAQESLASPYKHQRVTPAPNTEARADRERIRAETQKEFDKLNDQIKQATNTLNRSRRYSKAWDRANQEKRRLLDEQYRAEQALRKVDEQKYQMAMEDKYENPDNEPQRLAIEQYLRAKAGELHGKDVDDYPKAIQDLMAKEVAKRDVPEKYRERIAGYLAADIQNYPLVDTYYDYDKTIDRMVKSEEHAEWSKQALDRIRALDMDNYDKQRYVDEIGRLSIWDQDKVPEIINKAVESQEKYKTSMAESRAAAEKAKGEAEEKAAANARALEEAPMIETPKETKTPSGPRPFKPVQDNVLHNTVLPKRPLIPILGNVRVKDGELISTDLDTWVKTKTTMKDGFYKIAGGEFNKVQGNEEEWPVWPKAGEGQKTKIHVSADMIPRMMAHMSKDDTRYVLTGLQFQVHDGDLWMAATDGFHLTYHNLGKTRLSFTGKTATPKDFSAVLPAHAVEVLSKFKGDQDLSITFGDTWAEIENSQMTMAARLMEGTSPDVKNVIPSTTHGVSFNKAAMSAALDKLSKFATGKKGIETVRLYPKDDKIIIALDADDLGLKTIAVPVERTIEGNRKMAGKDGSVLMPIRGDAPNETPDFNLKYLKDVVNATSGDTVEWHRPEDYGAHAFAAPGEAVTITPPEIGKKKKLKDFAADESGQLNLEFLAPVVEGVKSVTTDLGKLAANMFYPEAGAPKESSKALYEYKGRIARERATAEARLDDLAKHVANISEKDFIEYIDKIRTGRAGELTGKMKEFNEVAKVFSDAMWDKVVELYPDMEARRKDNHALMTLQWVMDPSAEVSGELFDPRTLEGTKNFIKRRSDLTASEIIATGKRLKSTNPVQIFMHTLNNVAKYVYSGHLVRDAIDSDRWKYVPRGEPMPEGYAPLNDNIARVHKRLLFPEEVEGQEYVDKAVYDGLMKIASNIGITPERKPKIGGTRLGYASPTGETVTKSNTPLGVLAHEIGHQMHFKWDLWNRLVKEVEGIGKKGEVTKTASAKERGVMQRELRAIADATGRRKDYARSKVEKIAQMVEMYVHAKDAMKEIAPNVYKAFDDFITSRPELADMADIERGLRYDKLTSTQKLPKPVYVKAWNAVDEDGNVMASYPQKEQAARFAEANGLKVKQQIGMPKTEEAGQWVLPKSEARMLNNYVSRDAIRANTLGRFLNKAKNLWTGIELISGFHYSTIGQEMVSTKVSMGLQQLLRGDIEGLARNIGRPQDSLWIGHMAKEYMKDPEGWLANPENHAKMEKWFGKDAPKMEELVSAYFDGGGLTHQDPSLRWGASKLSGIDIAKEGIEKGDPAKVVIGGMKVPYDVAKFITRDLLFEKIIPNAKFSNFAMQYAYDLKQYAGQIDRGLLTKDELARRTVASIENRFGEMNWDNFWFNRTWKTALQTLFRSYTWQAGTWRGFGTAAKRIPEQVKFAVDAIKHGEKPPIDQDLTWAVGLVATHIAEAALIGYGAAYISGDEDLKPQTWFDYIFPKISLVTRLSIPGYVKEPISLEKSMEKDRWHLPVSYVTSKMTGFVGKFEELRANKNYYGDKIYDEDSPLFQKAKDIAEYSVAKPFSLTSYMSEREQGGGIGQALMGSFGFQKARWWVGKSDAETMMAGMHRKMEEGRSKEQAEYGKLKKEALQHLRDKGESWKDLPEDLKAKLDKLPDAKLDEIDKESQMSPLQVSFKHLDAKQAMKIWKVATPEERGQLEEIYDAKLSNYADKLSDEDYEKFKKEVAEAEAGTGKEAKPPEKMTLEELANGIRYSSDEEKKILRPFFRKKLFNKAGKLDEQTKKRYLNLLASMEDTD